MYEQAKWYAFFFDAGMWFMVFLMWLIVYRRIRDWSIFRR